MENLIKLLSKFSKYELLNNLIPGIAMSYILSVIGYKVWGENWIVNIVAAYFIGMICSRFSSLCIEEPFKKWKWIQWRKYEEFNVAKKERPFVALLQENANMYRSLAGVFILSFLAWGYHFLRTICSWLSYIEIPLLLLLLACLYIFSYRKQINDYVVKNIDEVNNKK